MNLVQIFSILVVIFGLIVVSFPKMFEKYLRVGNRAIPVYQKIGINKAEYLTRIFGLIILILGVIIYIIF